MSFEFSSIRQKLFASVLSTTLVALLVSLGAIVAYDLRLYHNVLISDMETQSELMGHMSSAALTFDDQRLAKENLALLRIRPKVRAAAIYNAKDSLFATYVAPGAGDWFPPAPQADGIRIEGNDLVVFKRIINEGTILGTVYLRADYELLDRMFDYLIIAAVVTLCAMLIAFLLMTRLARLVTDPIVAIAAIAGEVVRQRDYSRRANKISSDEVGMLVDSFNGMLSEIERRTKELEESNREIVREAEQRDRAQQEVMRLNTELELRVRERTAELEITNDELAQAKAVAENANQAKSAFLSSMSHELRTPLNAILGFAQLSDSSAIPATPAQKKVFIGHIVKAGKHLLTLINEVLDLAKVESGAMTLSLEPVALSEVMQESQAMIEPLGSRRGIRMIFPLQTELNVIVDRTRLKQILLNLLSNAIKYNRENGAVVVDCAAVSAERVRISVQDTGEGLTPEQLSALFQPFNRLGQETGPEEGTGIGLVVTKRLIELMGGEIGVTSTVGLGTVFWIDLKACAPMTSMVMSSAAAEPRPTYVPHENRKEPILLYVEDNPANLKLVEEIIAFRQGLRMLSAPDAHLGIELARVHLPDVILMDINLPGLSGHEARRVLQTDVRTSHIPIIALTANAMPRDVATGMASGFFRYITKPLDIDEFTEAIDSALALSEKSAGSL